MLDEKAMTMRSNKNVVKVVIPTFNQTGDKLLRVFSYKSKHMMGQILYKAQEAVTNTELASHPQGLYVSIACNEENPTVVCISARQDHTTLNSTTEKKQPQQQHTQPQQEQRYSRQLSSDGFWLDANATFENWGLEGEFVAELKLLAWELCVRVEFEDETPPEPQQANNEFKRMQRGTVMLATSGEFSRKQELIEDTLRTRLSRFGERRSSRILGRRPKSGSGTDSGSLIKGASVLYSSKGGSDEQQDSGSPTTEGGLLNTTNIGSEGSSFLLRKPFDPHLAVRDVLTELERETQKTEENWEEYGLFASCKTPQGQPDPERDIWLDETAPLYRFAYLIHNPNTQLLLKRKPKELRVIFQGNTQTFPLERKSAVLVKDVLHIIGCKVGLSIQQLTDYGLFVNGSMELSMVEEFNTSTVLKRRSSELQSGYWLSPESDFLRLNIDEVSHTHPHHNHTLILSRLHMCSVYCGYGQER